MVFKSLVSATCFLVFTAFNANASTIYTYTGNNFTDVTAPYTTSMNVTLQFETASPLSGTGSMVSVSSEILSYTISDGINTLTETDSTIDLLMNIDTTTGQPTEWAIHVTDEFGKSVGDIVNRMSTIYYDFSGGPDRALEAECVFMPIEGGECMGLIGGANAIVFNLPGSSGTWSVVPIPAAFWLFGSGLIGLIGVTKRKKS
jgi:hypothetical protein